jgi:hypothetical protein
MRRLLRNWMNDDSWGIGVLETLLLLSCIALIRALLGLLEHKLILGRDRIDVCWITPPTTSLNVRFGSLADI